MAYLYNLNLLHLDFKSGLILNNLAVSYFRDYTQIEKEFEHFHRLICEVKDD